MSDKSNKQSRREQIRRRQQRQQTTSRNIFIVVTVVFVGLLGYLFWPSFDGPPPDTGQDVEPMENSDHVEPNSLVEYSTNPPSSGPHYAQPMPAGFFNAGDILDPRPQGNIVHSLEHGYVVFWYNCSIISVSECDELKGQIQAVLDEVGSHKVIVFPWKSIDVPLAMTSWGKILNFPTFDAQLAEDFVSSNRSNPRAPEPNVP